MNRRNFLGLPKTTPKNPKIETTVSPLTWNSSPKIVLQSGWNTGNIGDQGHTPGTLRFLSQHFPEARITIWIRSTNDETNKLLTDRFPGIQIVMGDMDKFGKCTSKELQLAFDQCNLVIQNSGMVYNSFWRPGDLPEACNRNNKPYCLYGQSFDGFKEEDRKRMVPELSKAKAIYCRDVESYYYLRQIQVKPKILEWGPDGCFGMDLTNDSKALAYMAKQGLEMKKFITVLVRTNTGGKPDPSWDIGDTSQNPWNPTKEDAEQEELWMGKIREVIIHWVRTTGLKVFLAPEVKKEIFHGKRVIYDKLPKDVQGHVVHKTEWWNMDEACSMHKFSHTLISNEPHSEIMALAHGTPIIHYFSKRHGLKAWMFRDIGLPEWLLDIDEEPASRAIRVLDEINENYAEAEVKIKRAMQVVEKRSSEMIGDIKAFCSRA